MKRVNKNSFSPSGALRLSIYAFYRTRNHSVHFCRYILQGILCESYQKRKKYRYIFHLHPWLRSSLYPFLQNIHLPNGIMRTSHELAFTRSVNKYGNCANKLLYTLKYATSLRPPDKKLELLDSVCFKKFLYHILCHSDKCLIANTRPHTNRAMGVAHI